MRSAFDRGRMDRGAPMPYRRSSFPKTTWHAWRLGPSLPTMCVIGFGIHRTPERGRCWHSSFPSAHPSCTVRTRSDQAVPTPAYRTEGEPRGAGRDPGERRLLLRLALGRDEALDRTHMADST